MLAVELAQPGQLLRQVPAAVERGQHPDCPRCRPPALARREPERPERADRDRGRGLVPAAVRAQLRGQQGPAARGYGEPGVRGSGARARLPGIPDHRPRRTARRVGDLEHDRRTLAEQYPGVTGASQPHPAHRCRERPSPTAPARVTGEPARRKGARVTGASAGPAAAPARPCRVQVTGGPGPSRAPRRSRRRPWRLPVRPPAAAGSGAAASAGPGPSRRRG